MATVTNKRKVFSVEGKFKVTEIENGVKEADVYRELGVVNSANQTICKNQYYEINHGVPQGSILDPLLFLFHINDLPKIVHYNSKPTLFADDTSLIFSNPNYLDFKTTINNAFSQLYRCFDDYLLL
jgi:hypothetical protein